MKKLLTLITLLLIIVLPVLAQEYTLGLPNKKSYEDLYLLTKTNNNHIYSILLEQDKGGVKVIREYKSLDKETNIEKVHQVKNPGLLIGKVLNTFHYDDHFYFLNLSARIKDLAIYSLSTKTNKFSGLRFKISLEKKERVISNYFKNGLLYVFTIDKPSKQLKVHTLSLSNGAVKTTSIEIKKHDLAELEVATKNDLPISIIDYDNYNSMLSLTNNLKIFVEKEEIVFSIEHTSVGLINIYRIDLNTKTSKRLSLKKTNSGANTINATYFQGNVYRVVADRFNLRLDIVDIETEKTTVFEKDSENDYPFDFQSSNVVDQDLNVIENSERVLEKIGRRMSFVYPQIENGETSIYLGSIANPYRTQQFIEGLMMVANTASFHYSGVGLGTFGTNFSTLPVEEKVLKYVLMETNLGNDLETDTKSKFSETVNSSILEQRKAVLEIISKTGIKYVSVQKIDNKYYGVYHIEKTNKVVFSPLGLNTN